MAYLYWDGPQVISSYGIDMCRINMCLSLISVHFNSLRLSDAYKTIFMFQLYFHWPQCYGMWVQWFWVEKNELIPKLFGIAFMKYLIGLSVCLSLMCTVVHAFSWNSITFVSRTNIYLWFLFWAQNHLLFHRLQMTRDLALQDSGVISEMHIST